MSADEMAATVSFMADDLRRAHDAIADTEAALDVALAALDEIERICLNPPAQDYESHGERSRTAILRVCREIGGGRD